jgi:hypothetical protein
MIEKYKRETKKKIWEVTQMYNGRDLSELSMTPKTKWEDIELEHFHHSFQQITGYLNIEGNTMQKEIIKEIESRGGIHNQLAE